MTLRTGSLSYIPRLDGIRALAVFGVLFEHFAPSRLTFLSPGGAGVSVFFVLSGYLITRILLNYNQCSMLRAAKHFYWRRFLRLSPPFYLMIFLAVILGLPNMRAMSIIHSLYLTNFAIAHSGWGSGADHFWSLCTEEQFYLLWFALVVLASRRCIFPYFLACAALTLIFRTYIYVVGLSPLYTVLLPGNLVSLAMGALLADAQHREPLRWIWEGLKRPSVWMASTVTFLLLSITMHAFDPPRALFYPFVASFWAASLIVLSIDSAGSPFLDWLSWRPVRYVGRISYGIFVYHMFIPAILLMLPGMAWTREPSWTVFFLLVTLSFIAAHLSWIWLERPLLRHKDRFSLQPDGLGALGASSDRAPHHPATP